MGMIPAGKTKPLERGFMLRPSIIGYTITLMAKDPVGNVLWQKSWAYDEFIKLAEVGWKIVVGPETSQ